VTIGRHRGGIDRDHDRHAAARTDCSRALDVRGQVHVVPRPATQPLAPDRRQRVRDGPMEEHRRRWSRRVPQLDLDRVPLLRPDRPSVVRERKAPLVAGAHDLLEARAIDPAARAGESGEHVVDARPSTGVEPEGADLGSVPQEQAQELAGPDVLGGALGRVTIVGGHSRECNAVTRRRVARFPATLSTIMLSAIAFASALLAPAAAEATSDSSHLATLASTCERERGVAAKVFHKFLKREGRTHVGWTVLVAGTSAEAREKQAARIAEAAGAKLKLVRLADVHGKAIAETEKNLDAVFAAAVKDDAVLFFDEADALFGKRSEVKDAHDRYANQEVSYLLGRVKAHADVVIVGAATPTDDIVPLAPDWVDTVMTARREDVEGPLRWHSLCWPPRD
jgi:hypothetical protein